MELDPARRRRHGLATIFRSPAFDEAQTNRAHPRQLIDGLEALLPRLGEKSGEFLIVEDLQVASRGNFADCGRMPAVPLIAVGRLNEDRRFRLTFGEHLA